MRLGVMVKLLFVYALLWLCAALAAAYILSTHTRNPLAIIENIVSSLVAASLAVSIGWGLLRRNHYAYVCLQVVGLLATLMLAWAVGLTLWRIIDATLLNTSFNASMALRVTILYTLPLAVLLYGLWAYGFFLSLQPILRQQFIKKS